MPHPFRLPRRPLLASACFTLALATSMLIGAGCKKKSSPVAPTPQPEKLVNTNNAPASPANWEARTSMRTPANSGWTMYDDFVSTEGAVITRVTWQGIYCAEVLNAPPPAPTATGFRVGFYSDAGTNPNPSAPLQSTVYPISRVAETIDLSPVGNCGTTPTGIALYKYTVTLDAPFTASPGVRYWLGIQAQVDYLQANNPNFVYWGWRNGVVNNNRSIMIGPSGDRTEFALDRAYSIER